MNTSNIVPLDTARYKSGFSKIILIPALSPNADKKPINLSLSPDLMRSLAGAGRQTKLMEAWALLMGEKPPVNNIGKHENYKDMPLTPLIEAHQVWKGIRRACNDQDEGDDIYIYVTKPRYTYERVADIACMAIRVAVPDDEVLTVFVKLSQNSLDGDEPVGQIIGWKFFNTEPDKLTPIGSTNRYKERIW